MFRLRALCAAALSLSLVTVPVWGTSTPNVSPLGTVIAADRAHVGEAAADVGTTVYGGDRLSTEAQGNVQVRAGAARLLLLSSSAAIVNDTEGAPSAKLLLGTATFSTGNAHAFTLFASKAAIRPQTDAPTIGQVTYLNEKELLVTSRRGVLTVYRCTEMPAEADALAPQSLLDEIFPAAAYYHDTWGEPVVQARLAGFGGRYEEFREVVERELGCKAAPLSASAVLEERPAGEARLAIDRDFDALVGWMLYREE